MTVLLDQGIYVGRVYGAEDNRLTQVPAPEKRNRDVIINCDWHLAPTTTYFPSKDHRITREKSQPCEFFGILFNFEKTCCICKGR